MESLRIRPASALPGTTLPWLSLNGNLTTNAGELGLGDGLELLRGEVTVTSQAGGGCLWIDVSAR